MPKRPLIDVLRDHTPELMRRPGVVGTAEGEENGRPVFLILLSEAPAPGAEFPTVIEDYPVRLRVVGQVRADSSNRKP